MTEKRLPQTAPPVGHITTNAKGCTLAGNPRRWLRPMLTALGCAAWGWGGTVRLTVTEPSAVDRQRWPVTAGVPFARGELQSDKAVLTDGTGAVVPCDGRVLARWRDGSVLCLLLDFQTDLSAGESRSFRLAYGADAQSLSTPAVGLQAIAVSESEDTIAIDTGGLAVTISRRAFSLLSSATLADGTPLLAGPGSMYVDVDRVPPGEPNEEEWLRSSGDPAGARTERFDPTLSRQPFTARVEWQGSMRVVVRLDGMHATAAGEEGYPYTVRLTFHAGKAWVWLDHTLTFSGEVKRHFVRRIAVRHALAVKGTPSIVVGGATAHVMPDATSWASLLEPGNTTLRHGVPYTDIRPVAYQVDAGRAREDSQRIAAGERAKGWVCLRGAATAATSAVRHFSKLWPKEVCVDSQARALTQYLWPDRGGLVLDLRRRYDYVENEVHYDLSLHPNGGEGIAKTHELLLWFHDAQVPVDRIAAVVAAFETPLFAVAPSEWYGGSDFIPRFHPRDPARFPRFEAFMDLAMEWRLRNVAQFGWHGFVDFGDTMFHGYETPCHSGECSPKSWNSRGYVGWLNNDGAEARTILLHFLRSGDLRLLEHWRNMVRHVTDIDTVHVDANNPEFVGGGHRHDQQHWGNGVRGYGTATFGAMDLYLLTGDLRCLDVFKEYIGFHRRRIAEDEYVGGYLARYASVTGEPELWEEARREVRDNHFGFKTGYRGALDQPHFRCPTIQHPSLLAYLTLTDDEDMRNIWVDAAYKRLSSLSLGYSFLQFAYAYRYSRDPAFLDGLKLACSMWGVYVNPPLRQFEPATVLPTPLRELSFDALADLAKRTVNALYGQIDHVGVWPYMLAVAAESGLTEADLLESPPRLAKGGAGWDWGWTGSPLPGLVPEMTQPLDLRAAANANPWSELRAYGKPLEGAHPEGGDVLRFDFQSWGDVAPGHYPVRIPTIWPTSYRRDFTVREEGSYVYGLPWGGCIRLAGVTFGLVHPQANGGNAVVVLRDGDSVTVPVGIRAQRLFLLGMIADAAPFDHDVGARLSLRYADGAAETQDLRNLEHYENWRFWGFASAAHFARAFKVSSQWDGRTTLLNLLEVPLRGEQLDSVILSDAGKGHRLVVLALSVELARVPVAASTAVDLAKGVSWGAGNEHVTHSGPVTSVAGTATCRLDLSPDSYRLDVEVNGSGNGLAEIGVNGVPACTPFCHSKQSLPVTGDGYEQISVWAQAGASGLDITFRPAPGKGLWRHGTLHRQTIRVRNVTVRPERPPPWAAPTTGAVRCGWTAPVPDPFRLGSSLYRWQGAGQNADSDMIVGSEPATFRVELPPGRYSVRLVAPALTCTSRRVGQVVPGPGRVEFQDGGSVVLASPTPETPSTVETETDVGESGLSFTVTRAGEAKLWGLAAVEVRRK